MTFLEVMFLAVGLSMDAFAVSMASGAQLTIFDKKKAFKMAFFFGFFQALMPTIGWLLGLTFKNCISTYDHWVAFILLTFIGGKMLYESFDRECEVKDNKISPFKTLPLTILAIATSIDALAAGLSFSMLKMSIIMPAVIIGLTTLTFSFVGVKIGNKSNKCLEKKAETVGGIILILIGLKILLEHLSVI